MARRSKPKVEDKDIIRDLATLLRQNGERILSGQSKLSLTSRCLSILNHGFALLPGDEEFATSFDVLPPNSPKLPYAHDIQFLYDFVQKTVSLKVMHSMSTLQGRINLGPFRTLQMLELKKTPLHLLEGLGRMRVRLHAIVCSRSLSNLQELFETSGGDMTTPMSWPELRIACLSYNNIERLDTSLRLLPVLDMLDVSHNSITETDNCLELLSEVSMVNLGYNGLCDVPSFAISARAKLCTLVLRNNNLETLQGVEELLGLRDLDVGDNCMSDHQVALSPLKALHRLSFLVLDGNPLSFHEHHRFLTIGLLNATAAPRVKLNGKSVSQTEIQGAQRLLTSSTRVSTVPTQKFSSESPGVSSENELNSNQDLRRQEHTDTSIGSLQYKKSKKGGKSSKRVRRVQISDLESGGEPDQEPREETPLEKSKDSSPQTPEHLDVKKHMEIMRNQLGPDWLQTLVHTKVPANQTADKPGTSDTIEQSQTLAGPAHSATIIPSLNSGESPHHKVAHFEIGSIDSETDYLSKYQENMSTSLSQSNDTVTAPAKNVQPSRRGSMPARDADKADTLSDHLEIVGGTDTDVQHNDEPDITPVYHTQSTEIETIYDRKHERCSEKEEVDFGIESEPFIVSLLHNIDSEHLISITERYLLEKDINGDLIDALDLQCLLSVQVGTMATQADELILADGNDTNHETLTKKPESDEPWVTGPVVKLHFDYVKRDRRERHYVMEDEESAQALYGLLLPALEHNKAQALARDQMHCVKCGRDFPRQQARRRVRSKVNVSNMINDIYSSSLEKGDLEEMLMCPHCSSDMIIEVNVGHRSKGSAVSTPTGSFKEPMATSSANPSPWKRTESPRPDEDRRSLLSSSFKSAQGASSYGSATEASSIFRSAVETIDQPPISSHADIAALRCSDLFPVPGQQTVNVTAHLSGDGQVTRGQSSQAAQSVDPILKASEATQSATEVSMRSKDSKNSSLYTTPMGYQSFQGHQSNQEQEQMRTRQDSGNSDILVLSRHPHQSLSNYPSQDSDISFLTNPSISSVVVIDSETSSQETLDEIDGERVFHSYQSERVDISNLTSGGHAPAGETNHSPAESLTSKTLTSMVNSVYEKSIFDSKTSFQRDGLGTDANNTVDSVTVINSLGVSSFQSASSMTPPATRTNPFTYTDTDELTPVVAKRNLFPSNGSAEGTPLCSPVTSGGGGLTEDPSKARYWYDDFTQVDHRLKLYFTMSLFSHNEEEFSLIIRCGVIQYTKMEEVPGLLVISSHNIYFMKVTGEESAGHPEKWLKLIQTQLVSELRYIDIGLGCQSVRLEFSSEQSCFTLMIRDELRCQKFVSQLIAHIEGFTFSTHNKLEGISKNNAATTENLHSQILLHDEDDSFDDTISKYLLCYQQTGEIGLKGERSLTPASVLVTPSHLYLLSEDFRWPQPRCVDGAASKGQQFTLKDKQKVTDISQVDLFKTAPKDVAILFFDEESSEECTWRITMETDNAVISLVEAVREPWESQFGVELQISIEDDL